MHVERAVDIAAPPELVWDVMSDVERWSEWTPSIRDVRKLDGAELRPGARVRIRQPKLPTTVWTVRDVVPGRSFSWTSHAVGSRSFADHRIDPLPGGSSRVTLSIHVAGWSVPLVRPFLIGLVERYVALEAAGLKARCEDRAARGT